MIFIAGPTSSGKTSLAVELCKKYNGEIISADSRQIYKHFDVGTGKIPVGSDTAFVKDDFCWEIDGVKVWLYDVVDPKEVYTAVDFKDDAQRVIKDIESRGKVPFIVGGTGFYMATLLGYDIDVGVSRNDKLRNELQGLSLAELQTLIPEDMKSQINNSDFNNPVRLIRKIEILEGGGEIKSKDNFISPLESNLIILNRERSAIYGRVNKWVDLIWDPLLEEIQNLINLGYEDSTPMNGLIYNSALIHLKHKTSIKETKDRIKFDLHSYIRRQETWFKKYKMAKFLDPQNKSFDSEVIETVELLLNERKK